MLRFVRAFAWLRWRVLMNALERTGSRDTVERLSRATEQLGPILLTLLLAPALLGLAALGVLAGRAVGQDSSFESAFPLITRVVLLVLFVTAAVGPLFFPAARQSRNLTRLLLLPIPRRTLFLSESASCLADPWVIVMLPALAFIPVGLAWGGQPLAGAVALVSGAILFTLVVGLTFLITLLFQLVMRDRRRGELIAVALVFVPLLLSMFGMVVDGSSSAPGKHPTGGRDSGRSWVERPPGAGAMRYVPTEIYAATWLDPVSQPGRAAGAVAGLFVLAAAVQGLTWSAYRRLLAEPYGAGARAATGASATWSRLPGLTAAASAVAFAELRLLTRAPRGRVALITPMLVTSVFAVPVLLGRQSLPFEFTTVPPGLAFGTLAAGFALLALGPIALNQFATDGGGLMLLILTPVGDRDVIVGKAAGLSVAAFGSTFVSQLLLLALFPRTPFGLTMIGPLAAVSACLALSPLWAILSAVFPRSVDLNSMGRGSNPHGVANLLGSLAAAAAIAPTVALTATAVWWMREPNLAAPLLAVWCGVAFLAGRVVLTMAVATWRSRREHIALVAMNR